MMAVSGEAYSGEEERGGRGGEGREGSRGEGGEEREEGRRGKRGGEGRGEERRGVAVRTHKVWMW